MFLIGILGKVLLIGLMPEPEMLLLCGVTLVGGAVAARKIFKRKDEAEVERHDESETEK